MDPHKATLNGVVEDIVKAQLGFAEKEFVLNNEVGILYDADETENLPKKLSDLGMYLGCTRWKGATEANPLKVSNQAASLP